MCTCTSHEHVDPEDDSTLPSISNAAAVLSVVFFGSLFKSSLGELIVKSCSNDCIKAKCVVSSACTASYVISLSATTKTSFPGRKLLSKTVSDLILVTVLLVLL